MKKRLLFGINDGYFLFANRCFYFSDVELANKFADLKEVSVFSFQWIGK